MSPKQFQPCVLANSLSHVYDKIITVAVGPDNAKKKFKIYRGLLCHFSSYFDRMLNGSFREGGSTYLRLKDTDADTFDVFFYWLNSGVVGLADSGGLLDWGKVMKAYVFSDFHQAPIFKNAVLESLYTRWLSENVVAVDVTEFLYTNTSEGDSMRKLIVDIMVASGNFREGKRHHLFDCHKEFLIDIIVGCRARGLVPGDGSRIDADTWFVDMRTSFCERYHVHSERDAI